MFQLEEISPKIKIPKDIKKVNIRYELIKNFISVAIYYQGKELVYEIIEPKLTKKEAIIFDKLYEGLLQLIDLSPMDFKNKNELIKYFENKIKFLLKEYDYQVSEKSYNKLMYYIYRNFVGFNEIEGLMLDDYIEDINCNGLNTEVYIKHRLFGNLKTNIIYKNSKDIKNFIIKLAQRCNKHISYSNPFLEGSLADGSRIEGTISEEISPKGPNFSIRKFRRVPFSPTELIASNSISAEAFAYLWYLIEHKSNILIIGGAGVGKTTLLTSLLTFIPTNSKIVSIEDTREIRIHHGNWIATVSRESVGGLKIGEVDLNKLLRESFRENPEYVVVGEVRGKETYVMFQGMASGHPTLSTFHSEDLPSVISRLKNPPINLSSSLIELLDVVITIVKYESKNSIMRRVKKIEEFIKMDEIRGVAETKTIVSYNSKKDNFEYTPISRILEKISIDQGINLKNIKKIIKNREKFLLSLVRKKIFDMYEVQKEIENYVYDEK